MRGLGNYRTAAVIERKPGRLIGYRGNRATVRFHSGMTYALPAEPMRRMLIKEGERFTLIVQRVGKTIVEIRAEPLRPARPARARQVTPKVYMRDGQKVTTRKAR